MDTTIDTAPATEIALVDVEDTDTTEDGGNTNLAYAGVAAVTCVATVVTMKYVLPAVHGWIGSLITPTPEQIAEAEAKIAKVVAETTETEKADKAV